jgi:hypothetical protein
MTPPISMEVILEIGPSNRRQDCGGPHQESIKTALFKIGP